MIGSHITDNYTEVAIYLASDICVCQTQLVIEGRICALEVGKLRSDSRYDGSLFLSISRIISRRNICEIRNEFRLGCREGNKSSVEVSEFLGVLQYLCSLHFIVRLLGGCKSIFKSLGVLRHSRNLRRLKIAIGNIAVECLLVTSDCFTEIRNVRLCGLCRLLRFLRRCLGCVGNGIIGIFRSLNPVGNGELRTCLLVGLTAQHLILVGASIRRICSIDPDVTNLVWWVRLSAEHLHFPVCGLLRLACIGEGFGNICISDDSPLIGVPILGKAVCLARLVVVVKVAKMGIFILVGRPTAGWSILQGWNSFIKPSLDSPIHLILQVGNDLRVLDEIVYLLLGQALC